MRRGVGVYIHIPFCLRKCPYCDFYSLPMDDALADAYVAALLRAMERAPYGDVQANTVYFGGGTPSALGPRRLEAILHAAARHFSVSPGAEVTLEANPGAAHALDWKMLRQSGFNRLSFGVQSTDAAELAALGRIHSAADAFAAIEDAAKAGFCHISADVMLAIPGQTEASLDRTLRELCALPIDHLSAYLLKIEEGTPFMDEKIAAICPDEDEAAAMYLHCGDMLTRQGYDHYEISNFAKDGAVSRHNSKYWLGEEYLGLGPSAHSFMEGKRFFFPRALQAFCQEPDPWALRVSDGDGGDFQEYAMLRLRLSEGLDLGKAASRFQVDTAPIAARASPLEKQGLVTVRGNVVAMTPAGWLLSNTVTGKLLFG